MPSFQAAAKADISNAALMQATEIAPGVLDAPVTQPAGDAASKEALRRLNEAIAGLRHQEMPKLLRRAIRSINTHAYQDAEKLALTALKIDQNQGIAWHVLAIAREKQGDFGGSLRCYDAALKLLPEDTVIALDLGRLAARMSMQDLAVKLYDLYLAKNPDSVEAINNMASCLRDLTRYDEAIALVKPALTQHVDNAMLWNTLGTIVKAKGDNETSIVFFDEALRLAPNFAIAYHNRGGAHHDALDLERALEDCDAAINCGAGYADFENMKFSRGTVLLTMGRLEEGWEGYESRLIRGHGDSVRFVANAPRWTPDQPLQGRHLVIFCEQGVGDEVLFLNTLHDAITEAGPDGRITVITEKRLEALVQRSFPDVRVLQHRTVRLEGRVTRGCLDIETWDDVDFWTPAGTLLRRYRTRIDAFGARDSYLIPAPERVEHWRRWLGTLPHGPKVGILWKSQKVSGDRSRFYTPFDDWKPVLQTPGAVFINLQYGDCEPELAAAKRDFGVEVIQPPEIDLKADLDDLAALASVLDLVMGATNATLQIAGAVGTPIWRISTKSSWTQLGTDYYPWHPKARCFSIEDTRDWSPVMIEASSELAKAVTDSSVFIRPR